jgi:hypothetical protein
MNNNDNDEAQRQERDNGTRKEMQMWEMAKRFAARLLDIVGATTASSFTTSTN